MREIDYTKPLSEDDEAYLRERLPNELVEHMKAKAAGSEFESGIPAQLVDPTGALAGSETARTEAEGNGDGEQEPKVMGEGDDPADFTVDQVNAYLENAEEDEVERVLEAERDGEARKGILG